MIASMYHVFYEDVAGCGMAVSDNVKVTSKSTGNHEGLSWVAGGVVTMGNMFYKAYVLHLKWQMGWWYYSQTQMLR